MPSLATMRTINLHRVHEGEGERDDAREVKTERGEPTYVETETQ